MNAVRTGIFALRVSLILCMAPAMLHAQVPASSAVNAGPAASAPTYNPSQVFGAVPSEAPSIVPGSERTSLFGFFTRTLIGLILFVGAVLWAYQVFKKRSGGKGFGLGNLGIGQEGQLLVTETRPLGGKQYLLVVEYEDQKMLLGVSPDKIQYLTVLSPKFEAGLVDEAAGAGTSNI